MGANFDSSINDIWLLFRFIVLGRFRVDLVFHYSQNYLYERVKSTAQGMPPPSPEHNCAGNGRVCGWRFGG